MAILCKEGKKTAIQVSTETTPYHKGVIACRNCNSHVTQPESKIQKDHSFSHTFANPHGHVFEIGCFSDAPGVVAISGPSSEFTWFPGYTWRIGICTHCAVHLGWVFSSGRHRFYGLILDQLIMP